MGTSIKHLTVPVHTKVLYGTWMVHKSFCISLLMLCSCMNLPAAPPEYVFPKVIHGDSVEILWQTPSPFRFNSADIAASLALSVDDSSLVIGTDDGLACFSKRDGKYRWRTPLQLSNRYAEYWSPYELILDNGRIYVTAGSNALRGNQSAFVCVSASNGTVIWRHDLPDGDGFANGLTHFAQSPTAVFLRQNIHIVLSRLRKRMDMSCGIRSMQIWSVHREATTGQTSAICLSLLTEMACSISDADFGMSLVRNSIAGWWTPLMQRQVVFFVERSCHFPIVRSVGSAGKRIHFRL